MRILLTGSSGTVGSHTLKYLLARSHDITAVDISPPSSTTSINPFTSPPSAGVRQPGKLTFITCDLTDWHAVESLFASQPPFDGVIHFGAIPTMLTHDPRETHNTNVNSNYNVLQTAAAKGVKRIVQASSVNAIGLSYTPPGHKKFDTIPITEEEPITCVSELVPPEERWLIRRRRMHTPFPKREMLHLPRVTSADTSHP